MIETFTKTAAREQDTERNGWNGFQCKSVQTVSDKETGEIKEEEKKRVNMENSAHNHGL